MRVKIGNRWYESFPGRPIMVELTDKDKQNIVNMLPEATKYAEFHDEEKSTKEQKLAWMNQQED